jgi:hypothetical protein
MQPRQVAWIYADESDILELLSIREGRQGILSARNLLSGDPNKATHPLPCMKAGTYRSRVMAIADILECKAAVERNNPGAISISMTCMLRSCSQRYFHVVLEH